MLADALVIIDLQNGVCLGQNPVANLDELVDNINKRICDYWSHDKPIIFVQNTDDNLVRDSEAWQILSRINNSENDYYIEKTQANAFYQTKLHEQLTALHADTIEVCGAHTEYCLDATIKMAHGLGYDVQLKKGLTTTTDNKFMTAKQTISFYENIWQDRFLELV